ncbi:MAG: hypothetical protein HW421_2072 [Ignavibacteria bacterium]|nr:hypothetical protein [Ignavibacteria bacterium]
MKETFLERAKENLKIAELAFDNACFNASANRAYYSAFHAAIAAIYAADIIPNIDHKVIQALFAENYCNRRKRLPSKFKGYLFELQYYRNNADYKKGVSKKDAKQQLKNAKEFVEIILEYI